MSSLTFTCNCRISLEFGLQRKQVADDASDDEDDEDEDDEEEVIEELHQPASGDYYSRCVCAQVHSYAVSVSLATWIRWQQPCIGCDVLSA